MVTSIAGNGFPMLSVKPGRNSKCECGSGKKQKYCCGSEAKYYFSKLTEKQEAEIEHKKKSRRS